MRIVHFIPSVRPEIGGPARAVVDLSLALASRGHDVSLVTCDAQGVPGTWGVDVLQAPRHVLLPRPARAPLAFSRTQVARHVTPAIEGADALHLHGVWDPLNLQCAAVAGRLGVPYFISVRGMLDDWSMSQRWFKKRVYLWAAGRRWLERADAVHLTAEAERQQASKHFPGGHTVVIPNLLDLQPYRDLPGPAAARSAFPVLDNDGCRSVLFLSRIHPKKRLETLLHAAAILRKCGLNLNLIVAGVGDDEYLERMRVLASTLGLDGTVIHFVGLVTGELKLSLYEACDVLALPTSQENFGFVFPESLACGTPVVTTRGVDIWSELEQGGGAVIASDTHEAFAEALEGLLMDRDRARGMGARGREWVFQWLDTDRLLDQFEAMYSRGLQSPTIV